VISKIAVLANHSFDLAQRGPCCGISQHELAKRLNKAGLDISPAEVAEIEEGKRLLNYYQISVLASVLNATVFELNS